LARNRDVRGEGMSQSDALNEATSRLEKALENVEKTVADQRHASLTAEAMQEQIETLTATLGNERERARRLAEANDEVSSRLDSMIDSVKAVLGTR
jgi:predicted RNase H-like nuclease (RuvC/YqgF family)